MKIEKEHFNHGAALIQIAEDDRFTAINTLSVDGKKSKSAYRVNDDTGVYLKYAGRPNKAHSEYTFNFNRDHRRDLKKISNAVSRLVVAMACVEGRQICCIEYSELAKLFKSRRRAKGQTEEQIQVLVTMPPRKEFRVYVNAPNRKNRRLGDPILVPRNGFPEIVFTAE